MTILWFPLSMVLSGLGCFVLLGADRPKEVGAKANIRHLSVWTSGCLLIWFAGLFAGLVFAGGSKL